MIEGEFNCKVTVRIDFNDRASIIRTVDGVETRKRLENGGSDIKLSYKLPVTNTPKITNVDILKVEYE